MIKKIFSMLVVLVILLNNGNSNVFANVVTNVVTNTQEVKLTQEQQKLIENAKIDYTVKITGAVNPNEIICSLWLNSELNDSIKNNSNYSIYIKCFNGELNYKTETLVNDLSVLKKDSKLIDITNTTNSAFKLDTEMFVMISIYDKTTNKAICVQENLKKIKIDKSIPDICPKVYIESKGIYVYLGMTKKNFDEYFAEDFVKQQGKKIYNYKGITIVMADDMQHIESFCTSLCKEYMGFKINDVAPTPSTYTLKENERFKKDIMNLPPYLTYEDNIKMVQLVVMQEGKINSIGLTMGTDLYKALDIKMGY